MKNELNELEGSAGRSRFPYAILFAIAATLLALFVIVSLSLEIASNRDYFFDFGRSSDSQAFNNVTIGYSIDDKKAMDYVFGDSNQASGSYYWYPNAGEIKELKRRAFDAVSGQPLPVSVFATTTTSDGYFLVLTAVNGCKDRACRSVIGGFAFAKFDDSWRLVSRNNIIDVIGAFGKLGGKAAPIILGAHRGFILDSVYSAQGYSYDSLYLFAPVGRNFEEILSFSDAGGDDRGVAHGNKAFSYSSTMRLLSTYMNDWPQLKIQKTGTAEGDDSEVRKIDESHRFYFDGHEYVEWI